MSSILNRLRKGPSGDRPAPVVFSAYLQDWGATILLFLVFALIDKAPGFKREFSVNDLSIQHTYAVHERVPFWVAVVLAAILPLVVILLSWVWSRSTFDVHMGVLGLVLALALTTTVTDLIKITVGRPRPDLISRCMLAAGTMDAVPFGLVTVASCTQTSSAILNDGFKSFLSGHSSFSFCGLGYLSFWMSGKMHLYDQRGYAVKAWIALAPFVVAGLIAISRTMDYRHHATDVLAGSFLGLVIAYMTYRFYYPSLSSHDAHMPFAPRCTPASSFPSTNAASYLPPSEDPFAHQNASERLGERVSHDAWRGAPENGHGVNGNGNGNANGLANKAYATENV